MEFEIEHLKKTGFVNNERYSDKDFEITAVNYNAANQYGCEDSHTGAKPALLNYSSSYNPSNGEFSVDGLVVYVCPVCEKPVFEDE